MPYSSVSEAPANIRKLDGVALTLAQVNWIANVAEGLDPDKVENVWAVAIAQFKRSFVKRDGKWVKRETEEKRMSISESVRSLTKWLLGDDDEFGKWSPAVLLPKEAEIEKKDLSLRDIQSMIQDRVGPRPLEVAVNEERVWVEAIYPDTKKGYVILDKAGRLYRADYAIGDDGVIELSDAKQVEITYEAKALKAMDVGIKVFEVDGEPHWAAMTTNAFEDLEEETFETKVLADYVAAVEMGEVPAEFLAVLKERGLPTNPHGELWFAHIPYSRLGEPTWKGVHEHFLLEIGKFDDTPPAKAMAEYLKDNGEDYRVSHGYLYREGDRGDKLYSEPIWKFETSVLPASWAANPWTAFEILETEEKAMDEKQRAALVAIIGEEHAETLLAAAETKAEELKAAGISFKKLDEPEHTSEPELQPEEKETPAAVFSKDSEAFKFLVEKVAEALAPDKLATKEALAELANEVKAIQEADKPWAVLDRKSWNRPSEDPENVSEGGDGDGDTEIKTPSDTIREKMQNSMR